MGADKPRRRQRSVLYLEPKRAAATIGYSIVTLIAAAVCAAALLYQTQVWPQQWTIPSGVPPRAPDIVAAVAGCLGLIWLTVAIINGRRWHLGRAVERLSNDPVLARYLPDIHVPIAPSRAQVIPVLHVDDRKPREIPRPPHLSPVTAGNNVVGERPLAIVYLRMFENQPRTRTFIQGAWREFGYVYFLRSAKSVTPDEFRRARNAQNLPGLFISSPERLAAALDQPPPGPSPGHWHSFRNIGPQTIRARDRYGSYPPQAFLCHGAIWKEAVDMLLSRADLVVLDLSGFMPGNLGVRYELQRVVDRFPIERVILLADQRSDRGFLHTQVQHAWEQMAADSPNSGPQPRVARIAVTDIYRRRVQQQQRGPAGPQGQQVQTTVVQTRLVARRSQSRRLAADAPAAAQRSFRPSREPPGVRPAPAAAAYGTGGGGSHATTWISPPPGGARGRSGGPARPRPAPIAPVSVAARVAQFVVLTASLVFMASVTLLTGYVGGGAGVSLLKAATNDQASALMPPNFWISIGLAVLAFVATVTSMILDSRPLGIGAAVVSLGLAGYTLYLPKAVASFVPGPSYWLSLMAAAAMAVAGAVAAAA